MGRLFVSYFIKYEDKEVQRTLTEAGVICTSGDEITGAILKYALGKKKYKNVRSVLDLSDEEKKALGREFLQYLKENGNAWDRDIDASDSIGGLAIDNDVDYINETLNDEDELYLEDLEQELEQDLEEDQNVNANNDIAPRPADQDKVMKEYFVDPVVSGLNNIISNISKDQNISIEDDPRYQEIIDTNGNDREAAFEEAINFDTPYGKYFSSTSNNNYYRKVVDRSAYKRLKNKMNSLVQDIEDVIEKKVESGDLTVNEAMYYKSFYLSGIKRSLNGFPDYYISSRTPLGLIITSISTDIKAESAHHSLEKNMVKWEDKFPIYPLGIESENQLKTLADYWTEKEKGKLTPAKERLYRDTLYAQTLRLINMCDTIEKNVTNPDINRELQNDGIINGNPVLIHSCAARGMRDLRSSLDAYKVGLEMGWTIDDIGVLAAYKRCLDEVRTESNFDLHSNPEMLLPYDEPHFKNDEHRLYLEKMNTLYMTISKSRMTGKEMRNTFMKKMYDMVKEGAQKGFIDSQYVTKYFNNVYERNSQRNLLIEQGKEPAFHIENVNNSRERNTELNLLLTRFNASKSFFIKFGIQSAEHEALSNSVQKVIKKRKPIQWDSEEKIRGLNIEQLVDYFNALDEAIADSRFYQGEKKKKPSTEGGKDRLKGAKEIEELARLERNTIIKSFNHNRELENKERFKAESLEEFRVKAAKYTQDSGKVELLKLNNIPTDKKGKERLVDSAAKVLVYKFATSENESIKKAFHNIGINKLKEQIKKSSEFKRIMIEYIGTPGMTGEKLFEKLNGNDAISRMNEIRQKYEQKAGSDAEKTVAAEGKLRILH